ncbi:M23 family metallopeptidase [Streptomyces tauricus]|uniref:M23 family metallopeptidase n=1 Tax=Streptomyces tauricus TaxID=68274 RepID=UPI0022446090|nr:peptidoglycan DD-metalloendopeptidase family protein [Streptomyces tauricus]MCW8096260.1 peptidoglycan DD-metalloendopeptidase family protein [Streptomyces tauricus]
MPTLYKPLRGSHGISRGFTGRDYRTQHTGVDYRTPKRTPVLASAAGVVVRSVDLTVSYGRYIIIAHSGGVFTLYAHLDKRQAGEGARVAVGQRTGLSGSTGRSTGPHLHFEVRKGRNSSAATVNPVPLLKGSPPTVTELTEPTGLTGLTDAPGAVGAAVVSAPEAAEVTDVTDEPDTREVVEPGETVEPGEAVEPGGVREPGVAPDQ